MHLFFKDMKNYFVLTFFISYISISSANAQDNLPIYFGKRAFNRIYINIFNTISRKVYEEAVKGNLKTFKDETFQKTILKDEFGMLALYKEKITLEINKAGKIILKDTFILHKNNWEWIWGYKKLTSGNFAIYMQKPKDISTQQGEIVAYISSNELKKALTANEYKFINTQTLKYIIVDKQHLVQNFWKQYCDFKSNLWNDAMTAKVKAYQLPDFKTEYKIEDLKASYQSTQMITVVQDSLHREYDYQKAELVPFTPDSIMGFAFVIENILDTNLNSQILKPMAIAPLYDASNTGGESLFLDAMYWLPFNEAIKSLKPTELSFLNELISLAISEKLSTDCVY